MVTAFAILAMFFPLPFAMCHLYTTNTIWQTKLIVNPASRIPHYLQIPSLVVRHTVYPTFTPLNGVLNIF